MSISNSSDAAEAVGDASVRASVGAPSALAEAQRKLAEGGFDLGDLPQTRDDEIWGRIETEYQSLIERTVGSQELRLRPHNLEASCHALKVMASCTGSTMNASERSSPSRIGFPRRMSTPCLRSCWWTLVHNRS